MVYAPGSLMTGLVSAKGLERQLFGIMEKPVVIGCLLAFCNVTDDYFKAAT